MEEDSSSEEEDSVTDNDPAVRVTKDSDYHDKLKEAFRLVTNCGISQRKALKQCFLGRNAYESYVYSTNHISFSLSLINVYDVINCLVC